MQGQSVGMLRLGEISPQRSPRVCGTVFLAEGPANTEAPEGAWLGQNGGMGGARKVQGSP